MLDKTTGEHETFGHLYSKASMSMQGGSTKEIGLGSIVVMGAGTRAKPVAGDTAMVIALSYRGQVSFFVFCALPPLCLFSHVAVLSFSVF